MNTIVGNRSIDLSFFNKQKIIEKIKIAIPDLLAIYVFGSQIQGTANLDSDLDIAVLVAGYANTLDLWYLSSDLADIIGCDVDLLDFRAASTIMQYQILMTGERWWASDIQADLYECFVFSEKMALNENKFRSALLEEIGQSGVIYDR